MALYRSGDGTDRCMACGLHPDQCNCDQHKPVAYLRHSTTLGAFVVCDEGDPGAFAVYRAPIRFTEDDPYRWKTAGDARVRPAHKKGG